MFPNALNLDNLINMKTFPNLFVLFFLLFLLSCEQGPLIENYKIDGISIGDSLLDYLPEKEIINQVNNPRASYDHLNPTKKYSEIYISEGLKTYSAVSVFVENGDKKYIIHGMFGELENNSIEKCLEKKTKTIQEFDILFKEESTVSKEDYAIPQGFMYEYNYFLNPSDRATIQCVEAPEYRQHNMLMISLTSHDLGSWLFVE